MKWKENSWKCGPIAERDGRWVTGFMEKAEIFGTLVFSNKLWLLESQASEMHGKVWSNHDLLSGKGNTFKVYYLKNLGIHNSVVPDGVYP